MEIKKEQSGFWCNQKKSVAKHYWKYNNNRGKKFVEYFKMLDIKSIFEVGTNSGRNIYYINKNMPNKKLGGLDINKIAIDMARTNVPDANFYVTDIYNMNTNEKYDVVFTGGVLLHIPPQLVKEVISLCIRKSNKYVVHMEPMGNDIVIDGPEKFNPIRKIRKKLRCWHDIERIYKELGFRNKITLDKMSNNESFIVVDI